VLLGEHSGGYGDRAADKQQGAGNARHADTEIAW
jgi:hypothetical protein